MQSEIAIDVSLKTLMQKIEVVVQLEEGSLLMPEICGSNPVIEYILHFQM